MDENTIKLQAQQIVDRVKALVRDGSASRVRLVRNGKTLLDFSVNAGIIGALVGLKTAPFATLTALLISFGLDCEVEVEKKDGDVINLNHTRVGEKLGQMKNAAARKAKDFSGRVRGRSDAPIPTDFTDVAAADDENGAAEENRTDE